MQIWQLIYWQLIYWQSDMDMDFVLYQQASGATQTNTGHCTCPTPEDAWAVVRNKLLLCPHQCIRGGHEVRVILQQPFTFVIKQEKQGKQPESW